MEKERTDKEPITEFLDDVEHVLDKLTLEPQTLWGISKVPLLTLGTAAVLIGSGFLFNSDVWLFISVAGGSIFVLTAIVLFLVGVYTGLSLDRNTYTFNYDGIEISKRNEVKKRYAWKEILDLQFVEEDEKSKRKTICKVETAEEEIFITLLYFKEVKEGVYDYKKLKELILKYYKRKKDLE